MTIRIGVISDTHIPIARHDLPPQIFAAFDGVDNIFHLGDMTDLIVVEELGAIAPVHAVRGNMDSCRVAVKFPATKTLTIAGFKIGLIHGFGPPDGIRERIRSEFPAEVDIIVYGHSHIPFCGRESGIFYFNPGSPTDRRPTIGILELGTEICGSIIDL